MNEFGTMNNEAVVVYFRVLTKHPKERQRTPMSIFSQDGDIRIENLSRNFSSNKCKYSTKTLDVMITIKMMIYLDNF